MRNVLHVFARDVKRLATTPAAWSVVLFLMVLPSLYTWFNVAGFWNPYDNTGALEICVVNEDRGFKDDTLGSLDVGAQVVEQLEGNDQLGWMFCSEDEARSEVDSGRAYAAFIIPPNFSENVASLTSGNFEQPVLRYLVNEKTGPVAPKITDTGAGALETSVNDAFFSTVSSTVASILDERLGEAQLTARTAKQSAVARMGEALASVEGARSTLSNLESDLAETQQRTQAAKAGLDDARLAIDKASAKLERLSKSTSAANVALLSFTGSLNTALDASSAELSEAVEQTSYALSRTNAALVAAKGALGTDPQGDDAALVAALDRAIDAIVAAQDPLDKLARDALSDATAYRTQIAQSALPATSAALAQISSSTAALSATASAQQQLINQIEVVLGQLGQTLGLSRDALSRTDAMLAGLESELAGVRDDIAALASAGILDELLSDGGIDAEKIAEFMSSPTRVQTEELYPINAYGSAMAPLFINLTLWIGVFMLMVIVRLEVDDEGIDKLTIAQGYFARGMLLAIMACVQSAICCTGCLLMGVQSASVGMFYLTGAIASVAYLAIQYTLSCTLQHIGKAICIILVFVQIPGATGLYPIEMTPGFFQQVYPLFPFTYGINAIRETISGFYDGLWLQNVGVLVGFMAAFMAIGALARPYLANLNRMFAREIARSDLIVGETVELPARRYRLSQVINAFSDRDEYREAIDRRVARYLELYPNLIRAGIIVSLAILFVATAAMTFAGVERVYVLNTWLVLLLATVTYLIVVEYLRDYLAHLISLESMSTDELRKAFAGRNQLTRVMPIAARIDGRRGSGTPAGSKDTRDGSNGGRDA